MGAAEIVSLILGFFKFFDEVKWLIKTLQGTPVDKQQKLIASMQVEAENFRKTGRPTWDE